MKKNYVLLVMLAILSSLGFARADGSLVVQYTFDNVTDKQVADASGNGHTATIMNDAVIAENGKYKVLNLGNGTGYLDLGAAFGEQIKQLDDFTVSICYKVEETASLGGDGYFIWAFSTSDGPGETSGMYTAYRLNKQRFATSRGGWTGETGIEAGPAAAKGAWYNVVYRQTGTKGELYLNGELLVESSEETLMIAPKDVYTEPTTFNWIGRSPYALDAYLKNTQVYDFRLYNGSVSDAVVTELAAVAEDLNDEYGKDFIPLVQELLDEAIVLVEDHNGNEYPESSLRILEAIVTEVSGNDITSANAPGFFKRLQIAISEYKASAFGLKVHYDFKNVTGTTIPDISESGYNGTLHNEAKIVTMGDYNVLSLGNGTGYVDIGSEFGSVVSSMNNYTVSAYFRIDETEPMNGAGHFLWMFSTLEANASGVGEYIFFRPRDNHYAITAASWGSEKPVRPADLPAVKGSWQHVVYRQTGTTGEIYINGTLVSKADTIPSPGTNFTMPTPYNWIGRPAFSGDNTLKNTLVYDFRLYNTAVEDADIATWAAVTTALDDAYLNGGGDFTQLQTLLNDVNSFLGGITIGDGFAQYPQTAKDELDPIVQETQTLVSEGTASQLLIDSQLEKLQAASEKFKNSINAVMVYPEGNTPAPMFAFESGLYYIQVGDKFVTMPENGTTNTPLQLQEYIGNTDQVANNQVFKVEYNPTWSILEDDGTGTTDIRALFSIVSSTGIWTPSEDVAEESYWHMDEYGRMKQGGTAIAQSADGANWTWREHMLYYAGQNDASGNKLYSIVNHNQKASIYFKEATAGSNTTYTKDYKVYQFRFRTVEDVVNELGTSITVDQTSDVKVYGSQGEIVVTGAAAGDAIQVYDFSGRQVQSQKATGADSNIAVPAGFYIVKVADQVAKVIVR